MQKKIATLGMAVVGMLVSAETFAQKKTTPVKKPAAKKTVAPKTVAKPQATPSRPATTVGNSYTSTTAQPASATTTKAYTDNSRKTDYNTASGSVFHQGASLINVGVGLGVGYGGGLPIGLSYDYGVSKNISVGVQVDYMSWKYNYPGYGDFKYRFIPFGVRGAYHFDGVGDPNKVDLYLGLVLGYWISSYTAPDGFNTIDWTNSYAGRVLVGGIAGGRYMFNPKVGGFAELGYSVSYGKVGVTFKL